MLLTEPRSKMLQEGSFARDITRWESVGKEVELRLS